MNNRNDMVVGTCDGTGAAIYVSLGFIPRYVKLFNVEDSGNLLPVAEWCSQFAQVAALDEGIKYTGLSDTDMDRTVMAANGISAYAGGEVLQWDNAQSRWEYDHDDDGVIDQDATEVFVNGHYEMAASGAAYQDFGDSVDPNPRDGMKVTTTPGFTIGTDSDLNADGERLVWIAYR